MVKGRGSRSRGPWRILGMMSGTSLDGVDAAMVETDGRERLIFGPTAFRPYDETERATLRAALGHWPGSPEAEAAARVVEAAHAELASRFAQAQVVSFHGQTLAHAPQEGRTHQAGSGARLAAMLGRPVVWDFRSADVTLGGQGAPLVPFFHWALARHLGLREPVAFLNLGGVGNLTWVDPRAPAPETPGALVAFDTGPANAPIDDLLQARRGQPCDRDGALAAGGRPDMGVVEEALASPHFRRMPPKSLDRDAFAWLLDRVAGLSDADAAATLAAVAAAAVCAGAEHFPQPARRLLVSGGGRHNRVLMAMLRAGWGEGVDRVEAMGLDGDMLEAQAFAWLGARVMAGLPTSGPATTGVRAAICGGTVSTP